MKKLKLLSTILLVFLLSSLFIMPTAAISDPSPEANAVMLIDIATGNTLYAKNEDAVSAPASLTKIMTVMLAVEDIELGIVSGDDKVTASPNITYDLIMEGSTAGIEVGEIMSLEDLLYCAMVTSANEACNIIAEHISGSISDFVVRMNERAKELGCTNTNFTNTHGLPATGHYTTASDMAIISRAAISHPQFAAICNTASVTIPATNISEARHLKNTNGLISPEAELYSGYYYEYAFGVKTGHTEAAGYCLVSTAKKNGINLLCVVMGGRATSMADGMRYGNFTDSINLYNWAFENYSYRDILKVTDLVKDVSVEMGIEGDFVSLHPQNAVRALLPNDDDLQSFVQRIKIYSEETGEDVIAPIEAGYIMGEIAIERNGVIYGSSPLVASSSIGLNYTQFITKRIGEALGRPSVIIITMIILVLLIIYTILVVRYRASRRKFLAQQRRKGVVPVKKPASGHQENAKAPPPPEPKAKAPLQELKLKGLLPTPKLKAPPQKKPEPKRPGSDVQRMPQKKTAPKRPDSDVWRAPEKTLPDTPMDDYFNLTAETESLEAKAEREYFEEFFGKKE